MQNSPHKGISFYIIPEIIKLQGRFLLDILRMSVTLAVPVSAVFICCLYLMQSFNVSADLGILFYFFFLLFLVWLLASFKYALMRLFHDGEGDLNTFFLSEIKSILLSFKLFWRIKSKLFVAHKYHLTLSKLILEKISVEEAVRSTGDFKFSEFFKSNLMFFLMCLVLTPVWFLMAWVFTLFINTPFESFWKLLFLTSCYATLLFSVMGPLAAFDVLVYKIYQSQ